MASSKVCAMRKSVAVDMLSAIRTIVPRDLEVHWHNERFLTPMHELLIDFPHIHTLYQRWKNQPPSTSPLRLEVRSPKVGWIIIQGRTRIEDHSGSGIINCIDMRLQY